MKQSLLKKIIIAVIVILAAAAGWYFLYWKNTPAYAAGEIQQAVQHLSLIHICRCRRLNRCRSRWSPYH